MKDDYTTNSHCLTYKFLFNRLGVGTSWTWEWKGWNTGLATMAGFPKAPEGGGGGEGKTPRLLSLRSFSLAPVLLPNESCLKRTGCLQRRLRDETWRSRTHLHRVRWWGEGATWRRSGGVAAWVTAKPRADARGRDPRRCRGGWLARRAPAPRGRTDCSPRGGHLTKPAPLAKSPPRLATWRLATNSTAAPWSRGACLVRGHACISRVARHPWFARGSRHECLARAARTLRHACIARVDALHARYAAAAIRAACHARGVWVCLPLSTSRWKTCKHDRRTCPRVLRVSASAWCSRPSRRTCWYCNRKEDRIALRTSQGTCRPRGGRASAPRSDTPRRNWVHSVRDHSRHGNWTHGSQAHSCIVRRWGDKCRWSGEVDRCSCPRTCSHRSRHCNSRTVDKSWVSCSAGRRWLCRRVLGNTEL